MGILLNRVDRMISRLHAKGGGGGGAGQVSYPTYMETMHSTWLTAMASLITTATSGNSPYYSATAYDPDTDLASAATALSSFSSVVSSFDPATSWGTLFTTVAAKYDAADMTIDIEDNVDTHGDILDADLTNKVLPAFKRGMQNVNASMGSAFVIGEAIIRADRDRQLAAFQSDLEMKNVELTVERNKLITISTNNLLDKLSEEIEFYKSLAHYTLESMRIKIVAKTEETVANLEYDVKDAMWDLSVYKEGGNMLAAIGGGTVQTGPAEPSKAQSAIGGALSGAAAGAMVGSAFPGYGTAIGAVVGGVVGLAGGLIS